MKKAALLLTALLALFLFSCTPKSEAQTFVMNTFLTQTVWGGAEIAASNEALCRETENEFSKTIASSTVSALNKTKSAELSTDALYVFKTALDVGAKTGGALDIALGNVISLWGIGDKDYIPTDEEISAALKASGAQNIALDGENVKLGGGASVDLGAVVKGFALDKMGENTRNNGVSSALIDFGGSICAVGNRADGKPFKIGIKDPLGGESAYMATVELSDECMSTSGVYERYFERDGVRYHHIFDPQTGRPAQSGLLSVSVINEKGILTDAYSTALFVLGAEKGRQTAEENGIDALFITEDKKVITTDGFAEKYSLEVTGDYEAYN